jgi:hypothetical protein
MTDIDVAQRHRHTGEYHMMVRRQTLVKRVPSNIQSQEKYTEHILGSGKRAAPQRTFITLSA